MAHVAHRLSVGFHRRGYFYTWRNDGLLVEINAKSVEVARLAEGRKAQPTAGIITARA